MIVEVLLFDAKPGGIYEATSYTVFADGRLEVNLADQHNKDLGRRFPLGWTLDRLDATIRGVRRGCCVDPLRTQAFGGSRSLGGSRLGVVGDLQQIHDEMIFHGAFDGFPICPFDANGRVHPQRHRF
jgi:hypothetical protein